MIPICEKIFIVCPNTHKLSTAPANASGTVIIIINGSIKLSNCAASTKKISTNASINANEVLEELSAKSLEAPESEVSNDSSKTLSAIFSISAIPSPIVLPGASPACTVALLKRLK